jgi:hypothetical protein
MEGARASGAGVGAVSVSGAPESPDASCGASSTAPQNSLRPARPAGAGLCSRARIEPRALRAMLGLGDLILASLLALNAAAVLNEDRFLAKIGWGYEATRTEGASIKKQIINMLYAVRFLLTLPLIGLNTLVIVYKLVAG